LTVQVTETCEWTPNTAPNLDASFGNLTVSHNPDDDIILKIDEEEADPVPSLILSDGQAISLSNQQTDFEEFVSQNKLLHTKIDANLTVDITGDWYNANKSFKILDEEFVFPMWSIGVIGGVSVCFILILVWACCIFHKNKKETERQERELEIELQRCQEDGIEIPDELQKRLNRIRAKRGFSQVGDEKWEAKMEGKMEGKGRRRGTKGKGYDGVADDSNYMAKQDPVYQDQETGAIPDDGKKRSRMTRYQP